MKQSNIAVVVLNWNGREDSLACIAALKKQSQSHTIIAVDNGSTDGFVGEVEKSYPEIVLLKNNKNLGFAGGVNTGIRYAMKADFKYVALINNDAIPTKNWLECVLDCFTDQETGIVTGKLLKTDGTIDSTGDLYTSWGLPYPRGRGEQDSSKYSKAEPVFGATGGASLYSISMLRKIGLFDEDFFAYYEDVDLSFRAQLAGWKIMYQPSAVAYHKIGASSSKIKGFTTYQTIKNLPWLLWKNVPTSLLPIVWPRFFIAHATIIASALSRGEIIPVLKGVFVAFLRFPKKLLQRQSVQSSSVVSASYIRNLLVHDLPPNAYKLRKIRSFFVRR